MMTGISELLGFGNIRARSHSKVYLCHDAMVNEQLWRDQLLLHRHDCLSHRMHLPYRKQLGWQHSALPET
jgi:hypothetical protein